MHMIVARDSAANIVRFCRRGLNVMVTTKHHVSPHLAHSVGKGVGPFLNGHSGQADKTAAHTLGAALNLWYGRAADDASVHVIDGQIMRAQQRLPR